VAAADQSETPEPRSDMVSDHAAATDFRWQALFQRAGEPLFVLNRQRRILFVNRAWETLTGLSLAEVRGAVCRRRAAHADDPWDLAVRSLCCPPLEVLEGRSGRTRRAVAGAKQTGWWDFEFLPLRDDAGLLCVVGKITATCVAPAAAPPLSEKLANLRLVAMQRYGLDQLDSPAPLVRRLGAQIRVAAAAACPILIRGESGTGKEWSARAIHAAGPQRDKTFAALDCARLPLAPLADLLFGDASLLRKPGVGTVYLREPAQLPRDLQLRVSGWLSETAPDRPRLIAGCGVDLDEDRRAGRLLNELYCALATMVIDLPPLRERKEDLPWLIERLAPRVRGDDRPVRFADDAWELLRAYAWPGNVRELLVLLAAVARSGREVVAAADLPAPLRLPAVLQPAASKNETLPLDQLLEKVERRFIELALRRCRGNKTEAAEMLAIWRPRLLRRMEALGLVDRTEE
jgi:transcriptional regulator with PAS, ATPase and Fis domain